MDANQPSPRLKQLNDQQLSAFCAAISERLLPNYALFSQVAEFGNTQTLRTALDKIWDRLCNRCGAVNFETQMEKVDAVVPDPEEFDMYGVYPALDTCVALITTLNQMVEASHQDARQTSQLSLQGIETYLELIADAELSDEQLVRFINTHELIEQELEFQESLIDQLLQKASPDAATLDKIRTQAANDGVSNIGISLD
ncbi:YjaG family protein [Motiliproteus sp.]|uniref:YjaG family protein n=1 Tax=Motiliproteus sp. TaxID=1898955 RepID=UPI003BA944A7